MFLIIFRSENKDFKSPGTTWLVAELYLRSNDNGGILYYTVEHNGELTASQIWVLYCAFVPLGNATSCWLMTWIPPSKSPQVSTFWDCVSLYFALNKAGLQKKESWLCTLQESITYETVLISYWIANFQMGNQITVKQMQYTTHILCTL